MVNHPYPSLSRLSPCSAPVSVAVSGWVTTELQKLQQLVIACELCPRLRRHCEKVAREKRRAYRDWEYWGKPIASFGDPKARLLIVGLAPAAHGGNRTGRIFTGDRSGTFLMAAMHRAGFANKPDSVSRDDGLKLTDAYVTAIARCAPPNNKPTPKEIQTCLGYLERELDLLPNLRAVLCLGRIAYEGYLKALERKGHRLSRAAIPFGHAATHALPAPLPHLVCSYHPSQQNTQTGKLTAAMMDEVFTQIRKSSRAPKIPLQKIPLTLPSPPRGEGTTHIRTDRIPLHLCGAREYNLTH
jgi:uracil-DNA glycosylase family 4